MRWRQGFGSGLGPMAEDSQKKPKAHGAHGAPEAPELGWQRGLSRMASRPHRHPAGAFPPSSLGRPSILCLPPCHLGGCEEANQERRGQPHAAQGDRDNHLQ